MKVRERRTIATWRLCVSRLLVVDDDIQMQSALEAALRRKGFSVETASNGIEASRKLETIDVTAVLTDLRMPGMDGFELLQHIRESKPTLPVIVLSAYGTVPDAVEAIKAGASDFLLKPFSNDALDEALSRLPEARPNLVGGLSSDIITEDDEMKILLKR